MLNCSLMVRKGGNEDKIQKKYHETTKLHYHLSLNGISQRKSGNNQLKRKMPQKIWKRKKRNAEKCSKRIKDRILSFIRRWFPIFVPRKQAHKPIESALPWKCRGVISGWEQITMLEYSSMRGCCTLYTRLCNMKGSSIKSSFPRSLVGHREDDGRMYYTR